MEMTGEKDKERNEKAVCKAAHPENNAQELYAKAYRAGWNDALYELRRLIFNLMRG